jgi:uncharacterized protein
MTIETGVDTGKFEIRPVGGYFEVDDLGFIINPASIDKIQPELWQVINRVIELYKSACGDDLSAVYIRGSVPRGNFIAGISDIDTFAVVEDGSKFDGVSDLREFIKTEFDGLKAEIGLYDFVNLALPKLLNQSVCVFGEALDVPKIHVGDLTINVLRSLESRLDEARENLRDAENENDIKMVRVWCAWIMKQMVRYGAELVKPRSGKYTRDLYYCWKVFAEFYPEHSDSMYACLELAINPTTDQAEIEKVLEDIVPFLSAEILLYEQV